MKSKSVKYQEAVRRNLLCAGPLKKMDLTLLRKVAASTTQTSTLRVSLGIRKSDDQYDLAIAEVAKDIVSKGGAV